MKRPLSDEALEGLRGALDVLRDHRGGAVPHAALVDLASIAEGNCAISIDMEASEVLGAPLVVLSRTKPSWFGLLSTREREVAGLVARGLANKEIGTRLGITTGTVKDHVHRILVKTGLSSRAAIAAGARSSE